MDQYRKTFAQKVEITLNSLRRTQEKEIEAMKYLEDTSYTEKYEDLKRKINNRKNEIEIYEKKLNDVFKGAFDDEIIAEKETEQNLVKSKEHSARQKRSTAKAEKEEGLQRIKNKPNLHREENKQKRDMRYFYRRYCGIGDSFPDYMKKNLKKMPNNKGYIWKGCWFMGDKPEEPGQPMVMFEKNRGNILYIHEYGQNYYKLFTKKGKDRRKLVQHLRKKQK